MVDPTCFLFMPGWLPTKLQLHWRTLDLLALKECNLVSVPRLNILTLQEKNFNGSATDLQLQRPLRVRGAADLQRPLRVRGAADLQRPLRVRGAADLQRPLRVRSAADLQRSI